MAHATLRRVFKADMDEVLQLLHCVGIKRCMRCRNTGGVFGGSPPKDEGKSGASSFDGL